LANNKPHATDGGSTAISASQKEKIDRYNSYIVMAKRQWSNVYNPKAPQLAGQYHQLAEGYRQMAREEGITSGIIQAEDIVIFPTNELDVIQLIDDAGNATIGHPIGNGLKTTATGAKATKSIIKSVLKKYGKESEDVQDVWKLSGINRGKAIEKILSETDYSKAKGWGYVGELHNGYFPLIDFATDKTVVSLKTMNPISYKGNGANNKLLDYLGELRNRDIYINIEKVPNANKVLDIRVPTGTSNLINLEELEKASGGVQIILKEF
jgi:hypothetical protein